MKGKSGHGIIASGSKDFVKNLKSELEEKRDELRVKLVNPELTQSEKDDIRKEILELEKELKSKIKNLPFNLF